MTEREYKKELIRAIKYTVLLEITELLVAFFNFKESVHHYFSLKGHSASFLSNYKLLACLHSFSFKKFQKKITVNTIAIFEAHYKSTQVYLPRSI